MIYVSDVACNASAYKLEVFYKCCSENAGLTHLSPDGIRFDQA
jgi:hypothetical protein